MGGWEESPRSPTDPRRTRQQSARQSVGRSQSSMRRSNSLTDRSSRLHDLFPQLRARGCGPLSPLPFSTKKRGSAMSIREISQSASTSAGSSGSLGTPPGSVGSAGTGTPPGRASLKPFVLRHPGGSSIAHLRGSLATNSMPDLQKGPLKLMPLSPTRRGTVGATPQVYARTTLAGLQAKSLVERRRSGEDAQWAASTLSSPMNDPVEKTKPEFLSKQIGAAEKSPSSKVAAEEQELETGSAKVTVVVDEGKENHDDIARPIDGGPSMYEAFGRLSSGSEGFPETELHRMYSVFCRYKPVESSDINKQDLPRLLRQLNYFIPNDAMVHDLLDKTMDNRLDTMDFQDFEHFTMKYAAVEKEQIRAAYNMFDPDKNEKLPCSVLPDVFKKLDLCVQRPTMLEILSSLKTAESNLLTFNEFLRFMAIYKASEGFTVEGIAMFRKVFAELASPASASDEGGRSLKAHRSVLVDGLLQAFGESVHCHLAGLLEHTFWDPFKSAPIFFHEFVVWGRRLQELEVSSVQPCFSSADADQDGFISIEELIKAMEKLGYTLFSQALDEILAKIDGHRRMRFDFSAFFSFLKACQAQSGFTQQESESLKATYDKYDYDGSDGLDSLELLDMLRYLGYHTHLKDVHRYLKQVDYNGDGTMDFNEFKCLMRLHREEELLALRKIFDRHADSTGNLDTSDFENACEEAGCAGGEAEVDRVMEEMGNPESFDLEGFVCAVTMLRQFVIQIKRKRAGFSEQEFAIITNLFERYNKNGSGKLDKGNIILLLIDAGVPMDTVEQRKQVPEMFDDARQAAVENGTFPSDTGNPSSPRLMFWPLVHLLRALLKMDETSTMHREEQAMVETGFEPPEVQEFREIFLECIRWAAYGDGPIEFPSRHEEVKVAPTRARNRRATADLASIPNSRSGSKKRRESTSSRRDSVSSQLHLNPHMTLRELLMGDNKLQTAPTQGIQVILTRKLGVKLTTEQRKALDRQVELISKRDSENKESSPTGAAKDLGLAAGQDAVDFAGFLHLMRWIIETNFADINSIANTLAQEEKKEAKTKDGTTFHAAATTVKTAARLKNMISPNAVGA